MVKKGPCHHCGIASTPLWRNGPPEKPVLCNACGSRFRQWASLENYTPKHAQLQSSLNDQSETTQTNITATSSTININIDQPKDFTLGSIISPEGKLNPSLWNCSAVPSKKRSTVEKSSPMERFKKQMVSWWKQDKKKKGQSSSSSNNKEDDDQEVLITHRVNNLIVPSNEIGLGAMLHKPDHHK